MTSIVFIPNQAKKKTMNRTKDAFQEMYIFLLIVTEEGPDPLKLEPNPKQDQTKPESLS